MQLCVQSANWQPGLHWLESYLTRSRTSGINVTLTVKRLNSNQEVYALYINGYLDSTDAGSSGGQLTTGLVVDQRQRRMAWIVLMAVPSAVSWMKPWFMATNKMKSISGNTFHYQMASVEESGTLDLTIDADAPAVNLVSYDADFPYVNGNDRVLQVNARAMQPLG